MVEYQLHVRNPTTGEWCLCYRAPLKEESKARFEYLGSVGFHVRRISSDGVVYELISAEGFPTVFNRLRLEALSWCTSTGMRDAVKMQYSREHSLIVIFVSDVPYVIVYIPKASSKIPWWTTPVVEASLFNLILSYNKIVDLVPVDLGAPSWET